jgi:hypothetical protein
MMHAAIPTNHSSFSAPAKENIGSEVALHAAGRFN